MHINATFLVQIINFVVTYHILNCFLFKPVIASLKEKREKRDGLEHAIQTEEEKLLALEKEKTEKIVAFQTHVKESYPFISLAAIEKPSEITRVIPEKIDTDQLKKEVTQLLVEKVPHAY